VLLRQFHLANGPVAPTRRCSSMTRHPPTIRTIHRPQHCCRTASQLPRVGLLLLLLLLPGAAMKPMQSPTTTHS
jgi:hypothetical protein